MKNGIKNLINKLKGKIKDNEIVTIGRFSTDCPEVKIDNPELTVTLGQWMNVLPDAVKSGSRGMFVISHLGADDLIKKQAITKLEYSKIIRKFSKLLSMAGFGAGNTCVLDNFDDEHYTFRCTFEETGEVADIRIRFGSWLDEGPALIIDFDGIKSTYDYWHEDKKNPDRLHLSHVVKSLDKNINKEFYHYVSEFRYIGTVYDDENRVEVEIQYPESLDYGHTENPYVNKDLLEEILSSISFPINIQDLVARIADALSFDTNIYPTIAVVVKKIGTKDFITTDEAIFKNGEFDKLTITRDGKKVTVDQFDTWSYSTDIANVAQIQTPDHGKSLNYGYKSIPVDEFENLESPQVLVTEAKKEVEEVKTLAKTMLTKRTTK